MSFFQTGGGVSRPNQKFWGTFFLPQTSQEGGGSEQIQKFWGSFEVVLGQLHFFFASKPPKGGGVRANPKVLRQFWGSFGAVLGQNYCNISSISKGRNDFTHHQLKDYDVFSVKNLQ